MTELKRILIMAGGTGGHVFPGLAVANYMRKKGVEVHWLGTNTGLEAKLVPSASIPLHQVQIGGIRGKGLKPLLTAPFKIPAAILESRRIIKHIKPDLVIGMGGFVAGPGGVASWLANIPLVIHEQNAIAGYTNKRLAWFATKVLEGFPTAFKPDRKVVLTGNPVRVEIEALPQPGERYTSGGSTYRLLVLGGSLGAQALNTVVPRALAKLASQERPEIIHQCGDKHFLDTKKAYDSMGIELGTQVKLVPFIDDMAQAYSWADMVLCRPGALTVAELCAAGLGAILVPFPQAVDDHQTLNANFMVEHQAAICIQQTDLTEARLAAIVKEFSASPQRRLAMAQAAYQLRQVKVAEKIYAICQEVCR